MLRMYIYSISSLDITGETLTEKTLCPNLTIHHTNTHPPPLSPLGVHMFVLCICLYFCPANWFICTIILGSTYMR